MCGCSSSFDGDFNEIESNKTFSFVSDIETDNEFDNFLTKKMRERGKERKRLRDTGYSRKEARKIVKGKMELPTEKGSPAKIKPKDSVDNSRVAGSDDYDANTDTSVGMSNTKKALIGVGIAGVIGLGIYFMRRKK